jgi:hypothetical protein
MKTPKVLVILAFYSAATWIASSPAAAFVSIESDAITLTNPNGTLNNLSVSIPESTAEPLAFIAATNTVPNPDPLGAPIFPFNLTAGVTVWLEPGSNGGILPTNTTFGNLTLGSTFATLNDALTSLLGPSAKISDVFGLTAVVNGNASLAGFGLLSDNETSLSVGSFGLTTAFDPDIDPQPLRFAFEPAGAQAVGGVFLSTEANSAGYGLSISSDSDPAVPDSGMTLSLFGMALTGIAFLHRKIG